MWRGDGQRPLRGPHIASRDPPVLIHPSGSLQDFVSGVVASYDRRQEFHHRATNGAASKRPRDPADEIQNRPDASLFLGSWPDVGTENAAFRTGGTRDPAIRGRA